MFTFNKAPQLVVELVKGAEKLEARLYAELEALEANYLALFSAAGSVYRDFLGARTAVGFYCSGTWYAGFCWCAVGAVCSLVVVRPEMLCIMAGMTRRTVTRRDVSLSSSFLAAACARLVLLVRYAVPFCGCRPMMLVIMVGMTRGGFCGYTWPRFSSTAVVCLAGFAGGGAFRAAFPSVVVMPKMRRLGRYGPEGVAQLVLLVRFYGPLYLEATCSMSCCFRIQRYLISTVTQVSLISVNGGVARFRALLRNKDRYAQCKHSNFLLGHARHRRAENCGAPQLQFVDQVESSLFGKRDMYAQCHCAVFS